MHPGVFKEIAMELNFPVVNVNGEKYNIDSLVVRCIQAR
jgi:hypothetical protein